MTRAIRLMLALAALLALSPIVQAGASGRPAAHMLVYAQEWSLWASRGSVPAGRVSVQLWNRGQDAHDLRVRHVDRHGHMSGAIQGTAVTGSGSVSQASWRLRPGRYELYCSLPEHRQRGMHALLIVR